MSPIPLGIIASGHKAGSSWSPADLSGLIGWYDSTVTASITSSGGRASGWADQSGAGNHLAQTDSSKYAYTDGSLGGRTVLRFNGSVLHCGTSVSNPVTVAMAARWDAYADWTPAMGFSGAAFPAYQGSSSQGTATWLAYGGVILYSSVARDLSAHSLLTVIHGASSVIRIDATETTGDTGTYTNPRDRIAVGAQSGSTAGPPVTIGEVLIYSTALASTDRASVHAYLKAKWGTP